MKIIVLLTLVFGLTIVHCDGIDYWKAIKKDPLNWVDREISKEIVDDDQSVYIPRWNKNNPDFRMAERNWRSKNFKRKQNSNLGRSWRKGDSPELFFNDQSFISDLSKLPTSGKASSQPWSSTYWPIQYGILSVRYADNEKNSFYDEQGNPLTWKKSVNKYHEPQDYDQARHFENYVNTYFSSAEKYDLLVGDTKAFTLTNNNKNQGAAYENADGDVESWMGICHGWAPAAFSLPRPQNDVIITAADGKTKIKFYADDIRGLASMKYASSQYENLFAGGRCDLDEKKVPKDPDSGLITDYSCFDMNPGSWVLILANRMGIQKKSFVIDATFDLQVWNQPLYSYDMSYFNILTDAKGSLETSKIKVDEISTSNESVLKFIHKMVNPKATNIVGVSMNIVYIAETSPSHNPPGADRKLKVNYVFTLELDDQNIIIGGEWLHNQHPDFVWTPAEGAKPQNEEDMEISSSIHGDISSPEVLQIITQYAASASARGEVLDIVIDYLVKKSSGAAPSLRETSVETELNILRDAYERTTNEHSDFLSRN